MNEETKVTQPTKDEQPKITPQEPTAFNPNVDPTPDPTLVVGRVESTAPATKQDLDEMRDAVKELTKIIGESLKKLDEVMVRVKAGKF